MENTNEASSTVPGTELPFGPLPSFLPLNYLGDSVPPPPAPLPQPISEKSSFHDLIPEVISAASQLDSPALMTYLSNLTRIKMWT